jgi:hypothetical protein
MKAMQLAAKHLRDEAKAMPSGSMEYLDKSAKQKILGPRRATERRAHAELAMLRGAALGLSTTIRTNASTRLVQTVKGMFKQVKASVADTCADPQRSQAKDPRFRF